MQNFLCRISCIQVPRLEISDNQYYFAFGTRNREAHMERERRGRGYWQQKNAIIRKTVSLPEVKSVNNVS